MDNNITKYAILIGVSEYHDTIQNQPFMFNDIYRMAGILKFGGFSSRKIHMLTNQDSDVNAVIARPFRDTILHTVQQVAANARANDMILFYLAGHVVDIFTRPYLVTSDSKIDFLLKTTLSMHELLLPLEQSRCRNVIRMFDVCRGQVAKGRSLISHMTQGTLDRLTKPVPGHASLVSCHVNEYAKQDYDYKQGVCSYFINNALSGMCAPDTGTTTWDALSEYVQLRVQEWCAVNQVSQNPVIVSDYSGPAITIVDQESQQPSVDDQKINQHPEIDKDAPEPETKSTSGAYIQTLYHKGHIRPVPKPVSPAKRSFDDALNLLLDLIDEFIKEFSHPSIAVFRTEPVKMNILSYFVNQEFESFLNEQATDDIKNSIGIQIFFRHALAMAPHTSLYINLVEFPGYFWVWYCLPFETLRSIGEFTPKNPLKMDVIPLREPQLFDQAKLKRHISEIFRDCTETIIDWIKEMHDHRGEEDTTF